MNGKDVVSDRSRAAAMASFLIRREEDAAGDSRPIIILLVNVSIHSAELVRGYEARYSACSSLRPAADRVRVEGRQKGN
ncbi:MAG: hypothetical protein QW338_00840 [Conexivisphaerales archaeon]